MTIWPRSSEKAGTALRSLWARVSWRTADRWPVMAGSAHGRFPLIRNNSSCKTPEPDYPLALLPALEALTACLAFEEEYPMAFLQASEVSHPPKLPKKSTQGFSFKPRVFSPPPILPKKSIRWPSSRPWKLSLPAWLSKKTTRGSDYSSSGGSRVLMMAFSNSAIPTAPRCIKGLPSIGMKRREGIERIPNRAASSFSSSTLTL